MSSNKITWGPLLRYLFQSDTKVYKELSAYLGQDGCLTSECHLFLSSDACTSLKEKLLAHPQEAACIFHQLVARSKDIKTTKDAEQNALSSIEVTQSEETKTRREYQEAGCFSEDCSNLKKLFIECLDHCLRRVENLDEKLLKEEEEYLVLVKRQQKSLSPMLSPKAKANQKTFESIEVSRLQERKLTTNLEKLRHEELFYRLLSHSCDVDLAALSELFPRMIRLCYERDLLLPHKIHVSLLTSSKEFLNLFCNKENEYLLSKSRTKKFEHFQSLLSPSSSDIREIFLICAKNSRHILQIFYKTLANKQVAGMLEIETNPEYHWLMPLWPMLFIQALSKSHDRVEDPTCVAEVWEKHSEHVDPLLIKVCSDLSRDMSFVRWCLARKSRIKALPLLQLMRDHSPLYALHKSLPMNTLVPDDVLQIIKEHCMVRDSSGNLSSSCKDTYIAFCILYQVFEVIGAGMQLDNIVAGWQARGRLWVGKREGNVVNSFHDRQSHESFYKKNIAGKLECVKRMLNDLQPLEYRLEVMENIYSTIFVKHSDLSDEGQSESGGEEGDFERSYVSRQTDVDSLASTSQTTTSQRPNSPRKSNSTSLGTPDKDGDTKKNKELNFSDYVVIDDNFLVEGAHYSSKASNISSVSGDDGQSVSASRDCKEKNLLHATDTPANITQSISSCISAASEQVTWATYQQGSQSGQAGNPQSSCAMSGKSTTSSLSELPRTGYIINALVAWDILLLLRDTILTLSARSFAESAQQSQLLGSSSKQSFQNRSNYLSRCVNEGLWRLQIMTPSTHTFASSDVFNEFLDGTLLSNTTNCMRYEKPSSSSKEMGSSQGGKKRPAKDKDPVEVGGGSSEYKSILNFLFAPTPSLITLALTNGNVERINQIFQTYRISDTTTEKREACLAMRLNELRPKLSTANQRSGRLKEARMMQAGGNSKNMLQNIGMLAREGSAQVGATNLIYDLITSSPPPIPKGMPEAAAETGCSVMASFLTPQALVLSDLALTVDVSQTTATYLIEQALQRQLAYNSIHVMQKETHGGIQGYVPLLQQMGSTCSTIIQMSQSENEDKLATGSGDISENIPFHLSSLSATPYSLLVTFLPLKDTDLKNYIQGWSKVIASISSAQEALVICNIPKSQEASNVWSKTQMTQMHLSYKMLLHVLNEEAPHFHLSCVRDKLNGKMGAFLRSFYQYLQLLSAMVTQHAEQRLQKTRGNYFCLLTQRPVHILGSLMFQKGVDPVKLEPIASRMKLNLTTMILQYCCPKFKIPKGNLCRRIMYGTEKNKAEKLGFQVLQERVIMNGSAMHTRAGVYGEVVVRDILTAILVGLHETIQAVALTSKANHKAVILNDDTAPNALSSVDVQMALKDASNLAAVAFDKMVPGNEAIVFFINLANLMYIHAGILNHILYPCDKVTSKSRGLFSKHQLERIMAMKRLGYVVGQLGFLSLYDVLYNILPLQNPLSSILIQNDAEFKISMCESDLIYSREQTCKRAVLLQNSELLINLPSKVSYCITQGTPVSPRVQVLYADRMEEQIDVALHEHLKLFLVIQDGRRLHKNLDPSQESSDNAGHKKVNILASRTFLNYLAHHSHDLRGCIRSLQENAPEELVTTLKRLESEFSKKHKRDINVFDRTEEKGIVLEFIESFDEKSESTVFDIPEVSSLPAPSDDLPWLPVKVPYAVLTHLRKQCPLLAFIVQAFNSTAEMHKMNIQAWTDDAADTWLNILYPPSMGVKPPAEETKVFRPIRNLFSVDRHKTLARIFGGNKVTLALSQELEVSIIWDLADDLLGSGAITKEYSSRLLQHVTVLVTGLQALSSSTMEKHPDVKRLLDHLLVFLVQETDSEADPAPWMYASRIKDSDMRYKIVMEFHRKWPVLPAIDLLTLVAHDSQVTVSQQEHAKKRAEQIAVYDKILMMGNPSHESWQEVERLCTEEPEELLQYLIQKKQFKLGVEWADYHDGSAELRRLVDQSYLMDLLDKTTPDDNTALDALNALNINDLIIVVQNLLQRLSNIPTRRFLIEVFLKRIYSSDVISLSNENSGIAKNSKDSIHRNEQKYPNIEEGNFKDVSSHGIVSYVASLQHEVMGLILVEDVAPPAADRFQLSHLALAPHLIIEQWLMNVKLEAVEKSIKVLTPHLNMVGSLMPNADYSQDFGISFSMDSIAVQPRDIKGLSWDVFNWLLEVYAAKALDTTGVQLALKPHLISEKSKRKFVMPAQPPERHEWVPDAEVRQCPVCEVAIFSMFCRRHHCRRCGRVVCSSCSRHKNVVQGYDNLLVRVCSECYQQTKEINLHDYIQVRPLGDGTFDTLSQSSDEQVARGECSWASDPEGGWYLSTDTHNNSLIRLEFCYDYAPSLSLCLAILALHQDHKRAAICIVRLCHHLFSLVISSLRISSSETDHTFLLSMIQTLLTSSKIRFGNVGEHQGIGLCEYYTQWVDLLSILLKANCDDIIPLDALENMLIIGNLHQQSLVEEKAVQADLDKHLKQEFSYMRKLRNTLVKKQMWELALDVSTKAGLETNGVWGAWALASLKAGDYPGARERFSRVLERPTDKNRACNSSLLPEIIKYLESNPFQVDEQVINQADRSRSVIMLSDQSKLPPSQALVVLHSLKNLSKIAQGNLTCKDTPRQVFYGPRNKKADTSRIQSTFQTECKYYLSLYGNHSMTIQYFMRNRQMKECVEYLLVEDIPLEVFIDNVLVPCLRCGHLDHLMRCLYASDPHMEKWAKLMFGGCRWLERRGWWNCLLTLQEALGDRLRAAMTLLRMYSDDVNSYTALASRSSCVTVALGHLQSYLDSQTLYNSSTKRKKLILDMSPWHVNQNINMLTLQADVTKFLAGNESKGHISTDLLEKLYDMEVLKSRCLPTLLINNEERLATAILVICGAQILADGLNLAYRIVERSELPVEKLLTICCQLLMQKDKLNEVSLVVRGIQEWEALTPEAVDAALQPVLHTVATNNQNNYLDTLVKLLSSDKAKMEAFIECGRLKSAYLVAVHCGRHEDVKRVQEMARRGGQMHIVAMCSKWLSNSYKAMSTC
nr:uncharacterized protein LOC123746406 [Procambarus clarkii]